MSVESQLRSPVAPMPSATLADVDILLEFRSRPARAADYAREHHAFVRLTAALATNPRDMLQELVSVAVDLCNADTAGLSLLDGDVFRWEAVAGVFAAARGGTMPRDQSPCGICIDRDATQVMHLADRCFPALLAEPRFVEALLIPFHSKGKPVGTVWVVNHSAGKQFDVEDERVVSVLSEFASAGWQLWKAGEGLEREKAKRDEFVATLGHELRNPLGVITSATELLRMKTSVETGTLDIITRQVRHVTHLVDDLLDIGRMDSGKLHLDRQVVDLGALISDAVKTLSPQLERHGHQVPVLVGDEPVFVEADPVRLTQVVFNLVENAAKYTSPEGTISIRLKPGEDRVALEVRDTGAGIPSDSLQAIFEPFAQLTPRKGGVGGGLGLGLALVRRVVELHGGTVTAESPGLNQGSCFTVNLPTYRERAGVD